MAQITIDEQFPGVTWRVRNLLVRHGFRHLMEAARLSDDELMLQGKDPDAGGPIGPLTVAEIRRAERGYRDDMLQSDWPVF